VFFVGQAEKLGINRRLTVYAAFAKTAILGSFLRFACAKSYWH
jgi:hypothetical protein